MIWFLLQFCLDNNMYYYMNWLSQVFLGLLVIFAVASADEEASTDDTPANEASTDDTPVDEASTDDVPVDESSSSAPTEVAESESSSSDDVVTEAAE